MASHPSEAARAAGTVSSKGHGEEALTVARLVQERLLRDSVVLCAVPGLSPEIHWCVSVRQVDTARDDLAGTVVIGEQEELTPAVVGALAGAGAAAVFVRNWSASRWEEPGSGAGMPVVGIPQRATVTAVAQQVARLSLAYESHVLRYAQTVHTALVELLHRGAGVDALCQRMSRLSNCSVAVVGVDYQLMAFEQGPNTWIDPSSMGAAARELLARGEPVPEGSDHHAVGVHRVSIKDREVSCVIGAIELAERHDGWIVLADAHDPPHAHDLAEHEVVVQQAATIVGTELLRVRSVERAEERARGNFVHALLHGRFSTHSDLVARASHHDFDVDGSYGVIVAQARGLIAEDDSPARLANMAREASRIQPRPGRRTMAAVVGDVLAVVRQVSPPVRTEPDAGARELRDFAGALERRLQQQSGRPVLLGYGRPVAEAARIVESYQEARIALGLRARLNLPDVCGFAELRVHSTLLELAQQPTGKSFAEEMLGPLRGAQGGSLEEAVGTYIRAGGNLNEAARRLSVHRNTMLYKLDRASKLLKRDVKDPDTQFAISLAMNLDLLADTAADVSRDLDSG